MAPKLTPISIDNLHYEHESVNLLYSGVVLFRITNKPLNRGGKGLLLMDAKHQQIESCGRFTNWKHPYQRFIKKLIELGFELSIEEVEEAIKTRNAENIQTHNEEVSQRISEFEGIIKRNKSLNHDLQIQIHKLQNQIIKLNHDKSN